MTKSKCSGLKSSGHNCWFGVRTPSGGQCPFTPGVEHIWDPYLMRDAAEFHWQWQNSMGIGFPAMWFNQIHTHNSQQRNVSLLHFSPILLLDFNINLVCLPPIWTILFLHLYCKENKFNHVSSIYFSGRNSGWHPWRLFPAVDSKWFLCAHSRDAFPRDLNSVRINYRPLNTALEYKWKLQHSHLFTWRLFINNESVVALLWIAWTTD